MKLNLHATYVCVLVALGGQQSMALRRTKDKAAATK